MYTNLITCTSCGLQQGVVLSEIQLPDQTMVCSLCVDAAATLAATPAPAPKPVAAKIVVPVPAPVVVLADPAPAADATPAATK